MLDHTQHDRPIVVIGAGMGGLSAAIRLAAEGFRVTVVEKQAAPGGKARALDAGNGTTIDSGPTVLTMKWVFDELLALAGARLEEHVALKQASVLARHGWSDGTRLDLFADPRATADAIGAFAGAAEAAAYLAFQAESRAIFETLKRTYIAAERPSPFELAARIGAGNVSGMLALRPFTTLTRALSARFSDPRLVQLFGRYATYCGSSPYAAPATLMLVAHVEQEGVWLVEGGMSRLAQALANIAALRGVEFRYDTAIGRIETDGGAANGVTLETGERIATDAVIVNADASAVSDGRFGGLSVEHRSVPPNQRSLSAVTFSFCGRADGFPLAHHSVFFSDAYAHEFDEIFQRRRVPGRPTVYVCAQDRDDRGMLAGNVDPAMERLFCLINAPADGDLKEHTREEGEECLTRTLQTLRRAGLTLSPAAPERVSTTTPSDFAKLFPGSGGALYGRAQHGWMASFSRPGARTKVPGLYLAGGSVHPGPGVPMAALSGRLAAESLIADRASTRRYHRVVTSGGMSTG